MSFYEAFLEEMLSKLGEDSETQADMDQTEFEPPEPDSPMPAPPPEEMVEPQVETPHGDTAETGDLASMDTRRSLQDMLADTTGRDQIRDVYSDLRSRIDTLIGTRKAFTRSLLRARREIFGPSSEPRAELRRLLYKDEPLYEAEYV